MDFITQFENTLEHTILQGAYGDSHQLLQTFATTQMPYTLRLYSLINDLRACEQPFSVPITGKRFRVLVYKTGNFILDYIAGQFASFFKEKGYTLFVFDPADMEFCSNKLFDFLKDGLDGAFFFNNVGLLQKLADGKNLWETIHVPCFNLLVDHPMYYADSLDFAPARTTLLCADRTHVSYALRFYPNIDRAVFFPTGGEIAPEMKTEWQERPFDVLFIGSYKEHPDALCDEASAFIAKYLQYHTDEPFESAVTAYAMQHAQKNEKSNPCIKDDMLKTMIETHRFSETNLTAQYRKDILKQIVDGGITVHVYGSGWEQSGLSQHPNFILHDPVSFREGLTLMSQTKILLNHMAWFKCGSSERIFNAMSQGALCLTDSSIYLDRILTDNKNCALYSLNDVNTTLIADRIRTLLSSEETSKTIAQNGYVTSQEHTWHSHINAYLY